MNRRFEAVLNISTKKDAGEVLSLLNKVIIGLGENKTVFTAPDPTVEALEAGEKALSRLIIEASNGDRREIEARNALSVKVYQLLKYAAQYVSRVADGEREVILLSGFSANSEPAQGKAPGQARIRAIKDGKLPQSAKIILEPLGMPVRLQIQLSTDSSDATAWKLVLETTDSTKVELNGLERGKEIYFRVVALNKYGQGEWSEATSFIPR